MSTCTLGRHVCRDRERSWCKLVQPQERKHCNHIKHFQLQICFFVIFFFRKISTSLTHKNNPEREEEYWVFVFLKLLRFLSFWSSNNVNILQEECQHPVVIVYFTQHFCAVKTYVRGRHYWSCKKLEGYSHICAFGSNVHTILKILSLHSWPHLWAFYVNLIHCINI